MGTILLAALVVMVFGLDRRLTSTVPPREAVTLEEVRELVHAGRKLEAIKAYRTMSGVGLAEAKRAVESLE